MITFVIGLLPFASAGQAFAPSRDTPDGPALAPAEKFAVHSNDAHPPQRRDDIVIPEA